MEVTTRIKSRLTEVSEWSGVIDESGVAGRAPPARLRRSPTAFYHLAQACEGLLLDKAKAMTFYQTAVKRDRENLGPRGRRARSISRWPTSRWSPS